MTPHSTFSALPRRAAALASAVCAAWTLGGCAVGPDFARPSVPAGVNAPDAAAYTAQPVRLPAHHTPVPGGQAQRLVVGQAVSAQWWTLFQSPALDQLVQQALAHSPTLAAAQASLTLAQETLNAQTGGLQWPTVNAQAGVTRQRASAVSTGVPNGSLFTLYNASVNVSYTVDVFGVNRRTVEAGQAAVDVQAQALEASQLALSANVVTTAIRVASLRAQLRATRELLAGQEQQLAMVVKQFDLGAVGQSPVLAQRGLVAQTRAAVPALEKSLAQAEHQLAVYTGAPPNTALPVVELDRLQLPTDLPLSLPSELVRQRPDIRASEAQLHQASAQVGVATANLYPQLNLTGSYGSAALKSDNLFGSPWGFWSLAGGLTQPLFNAGALDAKRRAAVAAYEQSSQLYRQTVLAAFQNVADTLRALEADADVLQSQAEAESLAAQALSLAKQQHQLGALSTLVLLDAQRNLLQARINLVSARAARYADTAALFQALGGGWWNRPGAGAPTPP